MPTVPEKIAAVVTDPEARHTLLTLFAESIARIQSRRPEWCLVRFHGDHLRLFAGRLIVMTLESNRVWLATDPATQAELSLLSTWAWDKGSYPDEYPRYKRSPSLNGYFKPVSDDGGGWPIIRSSHFAYLDRVLAEGLAPDPRTVLHHEPLVIEHLLAMLREPLPVLQSEPSFDPEAIVDARKRILTSIVQRQGQPEFRQELLRAYSSRCAFSGCTVEKILDAAHILPFQGKQTNHVQNGLLLRTDLHTLFDLGLITVNGPAKTILVHPTLAGSEYADLHSRKLHLPMDATQHPSTAALDLHRKRFNEAVS